MNKRQSYFIILDNAAGQIRAFDMDFDSADQVREWIEEIGASNWVAVPDEGDILGDRGNETLDKNGDMRDNVESKNCAG